ncbi:hypothetical protein [Candidatus Paracaedibacter symbiosus]|nr:hypothetical protein [Candidatus Paracaedibacter symbiosus]
MRILFTCLVANPQLDEQEWFFRLDGALIEQQLVALIRLSEGYFEEIE